MNSFTALIFKGVPLCQTRIEDMTPYIGGDVLFIDGESYNHHIAHAKYASAETLFQMVVVVYRDRVEIRMGDPTQTKGSKYVTHVETLPKTCEIEVLWDRFVWQLLKGEQTDARYALLNALHVDSDL
jgi:hypothetical protein